MEYILFNFGLSVIGNIISGVVAGLILLQFSKKPRKQDRSKGKHARRG